MDEVIYQFPAYAQEIIDKIIKSDWLIHSLNIDNKNDIYNPAAYLYNEEFNGFDYTIHLDLNIYQYVISAFKKHKKNDLHRDAIALMVFGKFTNVLFDTTIAIYEKLNYLKQCPDEHVDDLYLFRCIDNSDMEGLAKFALGYTDNVQLKYIPPIEKETLKLNLTKYNRLKKWDTFYVFILKITELVYFDKSSNEEKIDKFFKWCFSEFIYSIVVISFVIKLFGKSNFPKLMKYKPNLTTSQKKNAIINMTWDLFLIDKFFEAWANKEHNKQFIYASNDKPLKSVLELAISIQTKGNGNHLKSDLTPNLIQEINSLEYAMKLTEGRKINDITDIKLYRDKLIKAFELTLLSK